MNGRMHCAFEAFLIDQHGHHADGVITLLASEPLTNAQRQELAAWLEKTRPDYQGMHCADKWPAFQAGWKLSREAMVITLPARAQPIDYQGQPIYSMSGEGRNAALDECRANIESEGVTISE